MDSRLKQLVLDDVVDKWHKGARPVKSADVYQNLVNVGEDIPAGAMVEILNALKHQNLIEGGLVAPPFLDHQAISSHGNVEITWINPRLL